MLQFKFTQFQEDINLPYLLRSLENHSNQILKQELDWRVKSELSAFISAYLELAPVCETSRHLKNCGARLRRYIGIPEMFSLCAYGR